MMLLGLVTCLTLAQLSLAQIDCTLGNKWVDGYIRYECYADQSTPKGIRPIQCVPDKKESGAGIGPGSQHKGDHFIYKCAFNADKSELSYKPIKCIANDKTVLEPDTTHVQDDGFTVSCLTTASGLEMKMKAPGGCFADGKEVAEGAKFEGPLVNDPYPTTTWMKCFWNGDAGKFEGRTYGCIVTVEGAKKYVKRNKFITMNGQGYQCKSGAVVDGQAATQLVPVQGATSCKDHNNVEREIGERWTDKADTKQAYECKMTSTGAQVSIRGCGDLFGDGAFKYLRGNSMKQYEGVWWWCKKGPDGIFKGFPIEVGMGTSQCSQNDKTFELWQYWAVGETRYRCAINSKMETYVQSIGCLFKNKNVGANRIATFPDSPGTAFKCEKKDGKYEIRQLDNAEYDAWYAQQQRPSGDGSVSGDGGAGSGATEKHTTPTTTTTKKPTTTTLTTKKPTTTTTTKKPTTTTTKKPTTTTTTTKKPTTTTTTEKPTTTTTKKPTTTTTKKPTTQAAPTRPTATAAPTTEMAAPCEDYADVCEELAPICMDEESSAKRGRHARHAGCQDRRRRCVDSGEGSMECELEQHHCCPCNYGGCGHCYDSQPQSNCKGCHKLKKQTARMVARMCPKTCGQCDKPHSKLTGEAAAQKFALEFLRGASRE